MRLSVGLRLYLLVVLFAIGCTALAAILIWLQEQRAWEARASQLQTLVESAIGVLETHKKLADAGSLSEADGKQRALDIIMDMRYGGGGYFTVWERSPQVLMLATGGQKQLIGKPQIDQKDLNGRYFIRDMLKEFERSQHMLFHILWTRPGLTEPVTIQAPTVPGAVTVEKLPDTAGNWKSPLVNGAAVVEVGMLKASAANAQTPVMVARMSLLISMIL